MEEKLLLVEKELAALNANQSEVAATQDENRVIIQEQSVIYDEIFHLLHDSDQLLLANHEHNIDFDNISSLLTIIHASVKNYSSAWFAFRWNNLISIPVSLERHLLMSLIPMESLLAIMDSVSNWQSKAGDRLLVTIQASDLMCFMILAGLLTLLRYQKDSYWFLTYRLLHSKLSLHFLEQNLIRCFFKTTLRRLLHVK